VELAEKNLQLVSSSRAAGSALTPSLLVVDCAGWACGRGSAWVGYNQKAFFGNKTQISQIEMKKNSTGFHVCEFSLQPKTGTVALGANVRFNFYNDLDGQTKAFCDYVEKLPSGRIIAITIADSAIAKSRPLGPEIYTALKQLGAAADCDVIGYRNPFIFVGVKGAAMGTAAFGLDKHAQSKSLLRIEVKLVKNEAGVVAISENTKSRVLLTDLLGKPKAIGKTKGGRLLFAKEDVEAAKAESASLAGSAQA
jgi:hypothetical protein